MEHILLLCVLLASVGTAVGAVMASLDWGPCWIRFLHQPSSTCGTGDEVDRARSGSPQSPGGRFEHAFEADGAGELRDALVTVPLRPVEGAGAALSREGAVAASPLNSNRNESSDPLLVGSGVSNALAAGTIGAAAVGGGSAAGGAAGLWAVLAGTVNPAALVALAGALIAAPFDGDSSPVQTETRYDGAVTVTHVSTTGRLELSASANPDRHVTAYLNAADEFVAPYEAGGYDVVVGVLGPDDEVRLDAAAPLLLGLNDVGGFIDDAIPIATQKELEKYKVQVTHSIEPPRLTLATPPVDEAVTSRTEGFDDVVPLDQTPADGHPDLRRLGIDSTISTAENTLHPDVLKALENNQFQHERRWPEYKATFRDLGFEEELADFGDDDRFLDSGTGSGFAPKGFLEDQSQRGRIVGVAYVPVENARARYSELTDVHGERVRFHFGLIEEYTVEELGTFRTIADVNGPMTWGADPFVVLHKYGELLEPGGKLFLRIAPSGFRLQSSRGPYRGKPALSEALLREWLDGSGFRVLEGPARRQDLDGSTLGWGFGLLRTDEPLAIPRLETISEEVPLNSYPVRVYRLPSQSMLRSFLNQLPFIE